MSSNDESVRSLALYVVLTLLMRVDSWLDLPFDILYGIRRAKFPKIFKSLFNHESGPKFPRTNTN